MQTRRGSFIESCANIAVGLVVGFFANLAILPTEGFNVSGSAAFRIGLWMTAISLVRSYCLRRLFTNIKANWNSGEEAEKHRPATGKPTLRVVP